MIDSAGDEYFTKRHRRLTNIAILANIFAWVAPAIQMLFIVGRIIQFRNLSIQSMPFGFQHLNIQEMLTRNYLYTFDLFVDLADILIRGIIYWLVLKGISLGLNMIIENNLNFKEALSNE